MVNACVVGMYCFWVGFDCGFEVEVEFEVEFEFEFQSKFEFEMEPKYLQNVRLS